MRDNETRKLRIEIPDPASGFGAKITDSAGVDIPCASARIAIDVDTMVPTLVLEVIDFEAQVIGEFRCEEIARRPLWPHDPEDKIRPVGIVYNS